MLQFIRENWEMLSGLGAGAFAIYFYVQSSRRELRNKESELAWKRTEFLFGISARLDTDPCLAEAIQILESRHSGVSLDQIFPSDPLKYDPHFDNDKQKVDRLLNLFHALAYAEETVKTLSIHELAVFGWYYQKICLHDGLRNYCMENGYHSIIDLCTRNRIWREGAGPEDFHTFQEIR